jgi:phosphoserine aminotransferase
MATLAKPTRRPGRPLFSSGPCAKIPGWAPELVRSALIGRSHRSTEGKARLQHAIALTREVLEVPPGHLIGIVPASDTGAIEMALWNLLGARGVDVLYWESFGQQWAKDIQQQLKIRDARVFPAPYGELPDLSQADGDRDVVFAWNGTTSGVRVPNSDWIDAERQGLTICDATSAVFAQPLDYTKLDVVTFSWQKALGGEAAHGMIVLSRRAVERLQRYSPPWPLPKIFRLTVDGKLITGIFDGETINTPSMICVEDWITALGWAKQAGGLKSLIAKANDNANAIAEWVGNSSWATHLARDPGTRSNTSVCLRTGDDRDLAKAVAHVLEGEGVAFDIGAHRDSPPGLRIWCGPTVQLRDIDALLPWLDWAHATVTRDGHEAVSPS